jgi:hypothetical protein
MKTIRTFINIILLLILFSQLSYAQCKSDECVGKISQGYTFLKSYQMEKVGDQLEYSYVFSKETNYMLVLCNPSGTSSAVVVTLFDSNRKEIASNWDKKNNKYYPAIAYQCKATGIYYLRFSFNDKPECCVSVLAFKK